MRTRILAQILRILVSASMVVSIVPKPTPSTIDEIVAGKARADEGLTHNLQTI